MNRIKPGIAALQAILFVLPTIGEVLLRQPLFYLSDIFNPPSTAIPASTGKAALSFNKNSQKDNSSFFNHRNTCFTKLSSS
jgi:hypothetical protein